MKKLLITTLVASSMAASVYADGMAHSHSAHHMGSWYARGQAGIVLAFPGSPALTYDTALAGVGVGYKFNNMFSADVLLNYYGATTDAPTPGTAVSNSAVSASINGYAGWVNSSKFVPYLTVGVGTNFTPREFSFAGATDRGFLTLGGGVKMQMVRSVDFDLGYRYGTTFNGGLFSGTATHQILAGVLYSF